MLYHATCLVLWLSPAVLHLAFNGRERLEAILVGPSPERYLSIHRVAFGQMALLRGQMRLLPSFLEKKMGSMQPQHANSVHIAMLGSASPAVCIFVPSAIKVMLVGLKRKDDGSVCCSRLPVCFLATCLPVSGCLLRPFSGRQSVRARHVSVDLRTVRTPCDTTPSGMGSRAGNGYQIWRPTPAPHPLPTVPQSHVQSSALCLTNGLWILRGTSYSNSVVPLPHTV